MHAPTRLVWGLALLVGCVNVALPPDLTNSDDGGGSAENDGGEPSLFEAGADRSSSAFDVAGGRPDSAEGADTSAFKETGSDTGSLEPDAAVADAPGLANGVACVTAAQCRSGTCVDGVCCNSVCGLCRACNLAGSLGTCTVVASGEDPRNECVTQPTAGCGFDGTCNGAGACRYYGSATMCSAPTCTNGSATPAAFCNGAGICQPVSARNCNAYPCKGSACATSCATLSDCQPGYTCRNNACGSSKIASLVVYDTLNAAGWHVQGNFQIGLSGARPWSDRTTTYVASMDAMATAVLPGKEWIQVVTQSKKYRGTQARLTLAAAADVYMIVDDRWTDLWWTEGWTDTGMQMQIWESSTLPAIQMSIYVKRNQTGSIDLSMIDDIVAYDYFIIVD